MPGLVLDDNIPVKAYPGQGMPRDDLPVKAPPKQPPPQLDAAAADAAAARFMLPQNFVTAPSKENFLQLEARCAGMEEEIARLHEIVASLNMGLDACVSVIAALNAAPNDDDPATVPAAPITAQWLGDDPVEAVYRTTTSSTASDAAETGYPDVEVFAQGEIVV